MENFVDEFFFSLILIKKFGYFSEDFKEKIKKNLGAFFFWGVGTYTFFRTWFRTLTTTSHIREPVGWSFNSKTSVAWGIFFSQMKKNHQNQRNEKNVVENFFAPILMKSFLYVSEHSNEKKNIPIFLQIFSYLFLRIPMQKICGHIK